MISYITTATNKGVHRAMKEIGEELEYEVTQCGASLDSETICDYDDPDDSRGTLIAIIALLSYCLHKSLSNRNNRY